MKKLIEENKQDCVKSIGYKACTFNHVPPKKAQQRDIYNRCVKPLINILFK